MLTTRPKPMVRIETCFLMAIATASLCLGSKVLADSGWRTPEPQFGISAASLESSDKNIVLGKPVDQRLAGGHTHTYKVDLQAGEFLQATVEQKGINLELTLYAPPPHRKKIVRVNLTLLGIVGRESVSYEATETGSYQLVVRPVNGGAPSGVYQIAIARHGRTTEQDQQRIKAERLLLDAIQASSPQQSIEKETEALKLWQALGDRYWEAYTVGLMGSDHRSSGRVDEALKSYHQALSIFSETGNRHGEASSLNNIGSTHLLLSHYKEAIDYYDKALSVYQEGGIRQGQGLVFINLGDVYVSLNDLDAAAKYYERGVRIFQDDKDRYYEGLALANLGVVYLTQKRYEKSIEYFDRAFRIDHAVGNRIGKGIARHNVGVAYSALKKFERAAKYFQQALSIYQIENDRHGEGLVLRDMGRAFYAQGDYAKALEYFQRALGIFLEVKIENPYDEAEILKDLMLVWSVLDRPNLAIFYGKQSVNLIQKIRQNIGSLKREERQKFLESKEDTYRALVELLITHERPFEAERVLKMLKEEEYFQFIRRSGPASIEQIASNPTEKEVTECYRRNSDERIGIANHRAQVGKRVEELKREFQISSKERLEKELDWNREQLNGLEKTGREADKNFQECLDSLKTAEKEITSRELREWVEALDRSGSLKNILKDMEYELAEKCVAVCTFVVEDRIHFIVLTAEASPVLRRSPTIEKAKLNALVIDFRRALTDPRKPPHLELAQCLYQNLIDPIAEDLKAAGARTILWSLDGVLRYLPLAALYDGKRYLVESYQSVIVALASTEFLSKKPESKKWNALGLGVTREHERFKALTRVESEMRSIINDRGGSDGLLPGEIYLDDQFDKGRLGEIRNHKVVHIASHFALNAGDETQSFLLLGDGTHLDLEEIKRMDFGGVDLLTLSACETAMGTKAEGQEVEGFAAIAQKRGAKAVIATLWEIADDSTAALMRQFYANKITLGRNKAAALQQAQLALRNQAAYTHPYYWAAFILIGNSY